jgi:hypothetical protein
MESLYSLIREAGKLASLISLYKKGENMQNDERPHLIDDIDEVLNGWIDDSIRWTNTAELMGEECADSSDMTPYEELLVAFDYLCQKLIPARIEHIKFLQNHDHDFDFVDHGYKCIHCGIRDEDYV